MLTTPQIRLLLDRLSEQTVVEPTDAFPYRITRRGVGWSNDPVTSSIQAALSILLATTSEKETR